MTYQSVVSELIATIQPDTVNGITTGLTRSCGKETGTLGSEGTETTNPDLIVSAGLPLENCPDPV